MNKLQKEIAESFVEFKKSMRSPNALYVKVKWQDYEFSDTDLQTIVLDGNDFPKVSEKDEDILYYASDIEEVLELCTDRGYDIADFKIVSFVSFATI